MTELQGKIYLTKADMPKGCDQCPFCNGADECIVQNEDSNFLADTWDDLRRGCPLEEIERVTVQEWISVKERTPTEADGTVWVCLADVFPYNEKEPYIDAKHDRRITEAFYSQFSKRWYKDGAVLPDGVVTHWMEKPQPPKGE